MLPCLDKVLSLDPHCSTEADRPNVISLQLVMKSESRLNGSFLDFDQMQEEANPDFLIWFPEPAKEMISVFPLAFTSCYAYAHREMIRYNLHSAAFLCSDFQHYANALMLMLFCENAMLCFGAKKKKVYSSQNPRFSRIC